jgi:hypothetical protein
MPVWGWMVGVTLAGASASQAPEQDIRPGVALPPDQPTPEAAHYEALLQGEPVLPAGDTVVEERRRFDDRPLRVGLGVSQLNSALLTALYTEVDAADRLALGGEVGVSMWGWLAGSYVRFRPAIWGGRGGRALHALSLNGGYRYMQYGDDPWSGILSAACHGDCERVEHVSRPLHFLTLGGGFEHSWQSGWLMRYALGVSFATDQPSWSCRRAGQAVPCGSEKPPASTQIFLGFVFSRAVF